MRWLLYPFWSSDERRLRAGLRLGLHTALVLAGVIALGWLHHLIGRDIESRPMHAVLYVLGSVALTGSVVFGAKVLDRRPLADVGLALGRGFGLDLLFGAVLGAALMGGIVLAEVALDAASYGPPAPSVGAPRVVWILTTGVLWVTVAINEELVFRGYHLINLAEGIGFGPLRAERALAVALLLSSAVFGLAHALNPNATLIGVVNITGAGVLLASGYVTTGRLAIPIGVHFGWNAFQNLYDMPVSGTSTYRYAAITSRVVEGPQWLTGGDFGPEAGLTGATAIALGTLVTLLWVRLRRGRLRLAPPLLRDRPPSG